MQELLHARIFPLSNFTRSQDRDSRVRTRTGRHDPTSQSPLCADGRRCFRAARTVNPELISKATVAADRIIPCLDRRQRTQRGRRRTLLILRTALAAARCVQRAISSQNSTCAAAQSDKDPRADEPHGLNLPRRIEDSGPCWAWMLVLHILGRRATVTHGKGATEIGGTQKFRPPRSHG